MKSTKISVAIQKTLMQELAEHHLVMSLVQALHENGGRVFLVGGAVRDLLLQQPCKDLDIEVHGLTSSDVERILTRFGPVSTVGKAFGVFRIHGLDVDWSLPRTDSSGRKPTVTVDPHMSLEDAFRRRDVTINAMGIDLITHELIDPFNGLRDLEQGVLRCPDTKLFIEDPLRFYRVMQFIGRFEMYPDDELNALCAGMDIATVSVERIEVEFQKLLLRSRQPSRGIRWLKAIGRLSSIMPELAATVGVVQDPHWHPEGDVFEHSMQAVDAAVAYTYDDVSIMLAMRYAAVCHDLGKVTTTECHADGTVTSYGHELVSVDCAKVLLKRITRNQELIDRVFLLVRYHMAPGQFVEGGAKSSAYKRLARAVAPLVTLNMLADLACADKRARNPCGSEPLAGPCNDIEIFRTKATTAQVIVAPEQPVLLGRDLLDVVSPGPQLGELLDRAYQIQIDEGITDKQELRQRVLMK